MKLLILLLLFTVVSFSSPLDVEFSNLGPWPLCRAFPAFCVPDELKTYIVLAKASGPEVVKFRFRLKYIQHGEVKTETGEFDRKDADTGYSSSGVLKLGLIDSVISVEADELVVK